MLHPDDGRTDGQQPDHKLDR